MGSGWLSQTDYKARHDNATKIVHKVLATNLNLIQDTTPYDTFHLHLLKTPNRSDILLKRKHTPEAILIDIAVPNMHNIIQTYPTKISKYRQLPIEMKAMLNLEKISILPLVISNVPIENLHLNDSIIVKMQKAVMLGICHIVRKFLEQSDHVSQNRLAPVGQSSVGHISSDAWINDR